MAAPKAKVRVPSSFHDALLVKDKARRSKRADLVRASSYEVPRRNDLLPDLQLVTRALQGLKAPKRNVRALDPGHVREVTNSIAGLGFTVPVVIDEDGTVLDGLVRLEAAKQLGLSAVPCVVAGHLTSKERRLLRLAINKLGEKGSWDLPELKLEFEELITDDVPIEITGFDSPEIDGILLSDDTVLEEGPLAPSSDDGAVAQSGDVFLLGAHRVICGDARDPAVLDRLMQDNVAGMVFTDQPYNVRIQGNVTKKDHQEFAMASGEMTQDEFRAFNEAWIGAALAHLAEGGILATFIDWRGLASVTGAALGAELTQLNLCVWAKTNAGQGSLYRSQHELVPVFKKGRAPHVNNIALGRKGRHRSNLWSYAGASSLGSDSRRGLEQHPTVKPVAMLIDALHDVTNRGDIVLDPFLGSGSTLIAAEQSGRICRGVELDPLYVDVVVRRYQDVTGDTAVLLASGETFDAVAARRSSEAQQPEVPFPPPTAETAPVRVRRRW